MTEQSEWQFLVDYVKDDTTDFRNSTCRSQLIALWTAYCMHHGLDVDTAQYDNDLLTLWTEVEATESDNVFWSDFDCFDNFMCCHLV